MKKSAVYTLIALSLSLLLLASLPTRKGQAQAHEDQAALEGHPTEFGTGSSAELQRAQSLTWEYLEGRKEKFGLDRKDHLKTLRVWVDELSMAHVHVQQTFEGVPVLGGEAIVHWQKDGTLSEVTNSWVPDLQVDTTPSLKAEAAVRTATDALGCSDCLTSKPEVKLWVVRHEGVDRLAYRVQLRREDGTDATSMPVYFVDAHTGEIFWDYDNLQTATGSSLYSGDVSFNTFYQPRTARYYLEDIVGKHCTRDANNGTGLAVSFTDVDNNWIDSYQRAGVDLHYGTSAVLGYYLNVHGRWGLDGAGGPAFQIAQDRVTRLLTTVAHYGSNYVNAQWNGIRGAFGDGDGIVSGPLVTLDIIGHELTHGVTEHTAGLIYSGEPGALNESMSDVFGAMVERYARIQAGDTDEVVRGAGIWMIAEECWTPGTAGDALRHMDDPHRASDRGFTANDDPDSYLERYRGFADNRGVHVNSGIPNKAFYLLAQGGTHHLGGSMQGIGADDAAKIWYKALTTYMTANTNFAGARNATELAALALFGRGSRQVLAVRQAWCLVAVGACNATETQN